MIVLKAIGWILAWLAGLALVAATLRLILGVFPPRD
jgi:hypothetical protein